MKSKVLFRLFLFLGLFCVFFFLSTDVYANAAYWATPSSGSKVTTLNVYKGDTIHLLLKVEIPANKILKAYTFKVTYDPDRATLREAKKPADYSLDVIVINKNVSGEVTLCGSGITSDGISGPASVSLLDLTLLARNTDGTFTLDIQAIKFGSLSSDQFLPSSEKAAITISPKPAPVAEVCDGKDNDGDGQVDEDLTRTSGLGKEMCMDGQWIQQKLLVQQLKFGDADGNGEVNIYDALELAKFSAGSKDPSQIFGLNRGDVDKNGTVDIYDALKIAKSAAKAISPLELSLLTSIEIENGHTINFHEFESGIFAINEQGDADKHTPVLEKYDLAGKSLSDVYRLLKPSALVVPKVVVEADQRDMESRVLFEKISTVLLAEPPVTFEQMQGMDLSLQNFKGISPQAPVRMGGGGWESWEGDAAWFKDNFCPGCQNCYTNYTWAKSESKTSTDFQSTGMAADFSCPADFKIYFYNNNLCSMFGINICNLIGINSIDNGWIVICHETLQPRHYSTWHFGSKNGKKFSQKSEIFGKDPNPRVHLSAKWWNR